MTNKQALIKRWERALNDPYISESVKTELRKAISQAKGSK